MKLPLLLVLALLLVALLPPGVAGKRLLLSSTSPPRQTATQRALVARLTADARAASAAATPALLAALATPELGQLLRQRGLPRLAAEPPAILLARLRAEAAAAEITHNLALGNGTVRRGESATSDGWAPGADSSMTRTPLFAMDTLPSLWSLGLLGYAEPGQVAGWMRGADAVECGILGCPAFTGTLPTTTTTTSGPAAGAASRPPYWPADEGEALNRPIYAVLDMNKIDVGVPDFGPVAIVMNRTSIAPLTALMPVDMGLWAPACRFEDRFHDGEQCGRQQTLATCEQPCGIGSKHCSTSCAWQPHGPCPARTAGEPFGAGCCVANATSDNCCSAQTQRNGSTPPGCAVCGVSGVRGGALASPDCCQRGFGAQVNCR